MPLVDNAVYMIRNDLTHTVLDFTGNTVRNAFVMGWGWHGEGNQKWKLMQTGANTWKLQNQRENPGRFLCPQLEDGQPDRRYRLAGGIFPCDFVIREVGGQYRILFNDLAVTLVTGQEVYNIQDQDRVHDVHADGSPIALNPVDESNSAQSWSFLPGDSDVTTALANGAYKIVNSQTGTVLDVADTVGIPVLGLVSKGGVYHKWIVAKDPNRDCYTFKSPTVADHFLAPDVTGDDRPRNRTALIGRLVRAELAARFTVRKVPGTQLYKIFFDPLAATDSVSGLAVNLAVADGAPDSLDGAVVSLQAAEAQQWYFVKVMP